MIYSNNSNNNNNSNNKSKKNKPVKNNGMRRAEEAVRAFRMSTMPDEINSMIRSDVLGSYTGMSYDGGEPDQDADDL